LDFLATARRQMLAGQIQDSRERLLASFAGLSDEQMLEPGVCGDWSARDILAHLASWDRATTQMYREMLAGSRPPFMDLEDEGIEQFNAKGHQATKDATLQEVMTELNASREEMLELLREVDNQALFAPAPGDDHATFSIAACISVTAAHDDEHAEMIEEWRENTGK
jgi:uncharacterized protein (TIGR03083 family)